MEKKNTVIVTVAGGFYFFGEEVGESDGYVIVKNAAMFNDFYDGKGMPGVARGDKGASVTLDFFAPDAVLRCPRENVYAIIDSIDLSEWENTTKR